MSENDAIRNLSSHDRQQLMGLLLKMRDLFENSRSSISPWANERLIELQDARKEEDAAFKDLTLRARPIGTAHIVDEGEADGER